MGSLSHRGLRLLWMILTLTEVLRECGSWWWGERQHREDLRPRLRLLTRRKLLRWSIYNVAWEGKLTQAYQKTCQGTQGMTRVGHAVTWLLSSEDCKSIKLTQWIWAQFLPRNEGHDLPWTWTLRMLGLPRLQLTTDFCYLAMQNSILLFFS